MLFLCEFNSTEIKFMYFIAIFLIVVWSNYGISFSKVFKTNFYLLDVFFKKKSVFSALLGF